VLVLSPVVWAGTPQAYITNLGDNTVSVIDTASNTVTATVSVGSFPNGVAVTPDGAHVYVAHVFGDTVSVIDTATNIVTATVTVGLHPFGVAVTPDGAHVYVANQGDGTVDGTVRDATGAMLTGIKVTLKNIDTGVSRDTTTNDSGYYFFPLVNPGRYEVSVEKVGFRRGTQEISVRTGIRSTADFSLELGQISESVQVTGEAALLETSTASVSRNIQERVVTDMPLLARNVLMLVNLAPGITNNSPTSNTNGLIDIDNMIWSYGAAENSN